MEVNLKVRVIMDKDINRVRTIFDNYAGEYGISFPYPALKFMYEYEKRRIISKFNSNIRVLDIGTGGGRYAKELTKKNIEVIGIDISRKMLKTGQRRLKNLSKVYFVLADASHLPFNSTAFDAVLCVRSLRHIPRKKNTLNETQRVLKKGGKLIVYDVRNKHTLQYVYNIITKKDLADSPPYYSIFDLKSYLRHLNFSNFEIQGFYHLPLRIYKRINNHQTFQYLIKIERILNKIFPDALFAHGFLITCKKI